MKRLLLGLITASFLLGVSCKDDPKSSGNGRLMIVPGVDTKTVDRDLTRATPTTDFSTYSVILDGPVSKTIPYPTGGQVPDVLTGSYNITVTSHTTMPAPAFDVQVYSGTVAATVKADETTPLAMVLTQANAGLYFEYDQSIIDAGVELMPTVKNSAGSLTYSGSNKDKWGYFAPGEVTVTVTDGARDYKLNGEFEPKLTLGAREVWKILLKYEPEVGSLGITMQVEVIDDYTNEQVFIVGEPSPRYIDLDWVAYAYYYGSSIGNNEGPSEFKVRLLGGTTPPVPAITIHGFTQNSPFATFSLAEGEYTLSDDESAMTVTAGYMDDDTYLFGTYGMTFSSSAITGLWLATGGTINIERSGDTYTISTLLEGSDNGADGYGNLFYRYTGKIDWVNEYIPMGDLEFEDVNEGDYNASGIPGEWLSAPGPANWTQTLERVIANDGDLQVFSFMGFAGEAEDPFPMEYTFRNAVLTNNLGISFGNGLYTVYPEAYYENPDRENYYITIRNYVVPFDEITQTFDFSGEFNGKPVIVGLNAYDIDGNWAAAISEQYTDLKFEGVATRGSSYSPSSITRRVDGFYMESPTGLYKSKKPFIIEGSIDYAEYLKKKRGDRM